MNGACLPWTRVAGARLHLGIPLMIDLLLHSIISFREQRTSEWTTDFLSNIVAVSFKWQFLGGSFSSDRDFVIVSLNPQFPQSCVSVCD